VSVELLDTDANIRSMTGVQAPHIPYARIEAALRAGHLAFLLAHVDSLSLGSEAEMCRLIAEQRPGRLEQASLRWIRRFANEAHGQRRGDYLLILQAFDQFLLAPERSASQLVSLCAARGLD
jgi:hypothetical protein